MDTHPYRIGIAGLGTVGVGVLEALRSNGGLIASRAGRAVEIVAVSARNRAKDRGVDMSSYAWVDDPVDLAGRDDLDAVVELIGGEGGAALALLERALANGKPVVTANKALLAHRGYDLAVLAEENGAALMFEAAVAGGVPIIKSLREGYAANTIRAVYGILNGTCNYILTEMRETRRDFPDVLKEAQDKGYAEADPAFDIDGVDSAHKLCLLSALSFGVRPDFEGVSVRGISSVTAEDISYAESLGYKIKLLAISRVSNGKVMQMVEPCLVPEDSTMGAVEGVYNAVSVDADFAGTGLAVGRGAGRRPTASAVVSDIIDLARGHKGPAFGVPASSLLQAERGDPGTLEGRFYIRLSVIDKPGVLADITAIMRDCNVSMETVAQHGRDPHKPVSVVIISHSTARAGIRRAVDAIGRLDSVVGAPGLLRIETF